MNDNRKILIADDEAHILHVVRIKLQKGGFDVVEALDGREALDLANRLHPLAIVTDLQMPYLSGLELAAALARHPDTADIPVILLTAKGFEVDGFATTGTNIKYVMTKPFSPRDLLSKVNECVAVAV
jgi:DNA-binding response OmpR family regulator